MARQAELERKLREIRRQEQTIKERIYRLEAVIAAEPARSSRSRLNSWNTIPPDDVDRESTARSRGTRWQRQRLNRARSRQALIAGFLVVLMVLFFCWFQYQLRIHGIL